MKLFVLALGLAAALPPVAAFASPPEAIVTSVRVSYADVDLSRPSGAKVMRMRLERAALSVCGASDFSARDVREEVRNSACYRHALDQAAAQIGAPDLAAPPRQ